MILWRVSIFRDLLGIGGLHAPGRWHHAGQPVVYLAESPSGALLESCVHTAADDIPATFTLLRVQGPEMEIREVSDGELPPGWAEDPEWSRDRGTAWLRGAGGVLLRIRSAIVPHTHNLLFNPAHPDAKLFRITETLPYPFDRRLKQ